MNDMPRRTMLPPDGPPQPDRARHHRAGLFGVLDIGTVHTVPVPVPQSATDTAAFAAGSVFTASLRSGERLVDRVEHPAPPVTECAPPGRAPTRPAEDRSSDNSAGGAPQSVPATTFCRPTSCAY